MLPEVRTAYRNQIGTRTWAPLSGGPNGTFFLGKPLVTVARDVGLKISAGLPEKVAGFVPTVTRRCSRRCGGTGRSGDPQGVSAVALSTRLLGRRSVQFRSTWSRQAWRVSSG